MKTSDIKLLIDAFYKGETSIEEELFLYDYFKSDKVAEEFLPEKEYFLQMQQLEPIEIPMGFSSKIDTVFAKLEEKEKNTNKRRRIWLSVGSVAAVAIILIIGYQWNDSKSLDTRLAIVDTTYSDPSSVTYLVDTAKIEQIDTNIIKENKNKTPSQKAQTNKPKKKLTKKEMEDYKEMAKALEMVSSNIDKGLKQLDLVSENFVETNEILNNK